VNNFLFHGSCSRCWSVGRSVVRAGRTYIKKKSKPQTLVHHKHRLEERKRRRRVCLCVCVCDCATPVSLLSFLCVVVVAVVVQQEDKVGGSDPFVGCGET
jgi:hypothetical protein